MLLDGVRSEAFVFAGSLTQGSNSVIRIGLVLNNAQRRCKYEINTHYCEHCELHLQRQEAHDEPQRLSVWLGAVLRQVGGHQVPTQ
jgi:hypothetical protein